MGNSQWCYATVIFFMILVVAISAQPLQHITLWEKIIDNFHAVEKGLLYRSKQLSCKKLRAYVERFNIKTIINLRGKNKSALWWHQEKKCVQELGIKFFNIASNASRPSTKHEICQILSLYDHAPKPILIHCYSGSDRTGEAAALWCLDQQNNRKAACKQLSWRFGHIQSRRPYKIKLIKVWSGRKWLIHHYNPNLL